MTPLVHISAAKSFAGDALPLGSHYVEKVPVVVIAMHEGCECRCVMCDIWKIREPQEIATRHLQRQLDSFQKLGVRWVALSGGEAHHHSHFEEFTSSLKSRGIRVTLLTAGLFSVMDAKKIGAAVDEVIVSLDGTRAIHNLIRRVPYAFERLEAGIRALRTIRPGFPITARCTVQRANHHALCATVDCAKSLGLDSISFLAADLVSSAFNRSSPWSVPRQNGVGLRESQVDALEEQVERMIADRDCGRMVAETPEKLRRIVLHFRAHLGQVAPVAPKCNAPWVSAFIEAGGHVRPCFFHAPIGDLSSRTFDQIINGPDAIRFRSALEVATNPVCQRCVCSLYLPVANMPAAYSHEATAPSLLRNINNQQPADARGSESQRTGI